MKCLWVIPKAIFPIRDGARVANDSLLKSFGPLCEELDILMFNEQENEKDVDLYKKIYSAKNVFFLKKATQVSKKEKLGQLIKGFLRHPFTPVTTSYFSKDKGLIEGILKNNYDLIVFDGLHSYRILDEIDVKAKIIYRAHNVEGDLWSTAASKTTNPLFKLGLLWQGSLMHAFEKKLIERATRVWSIASEDQKRFIDLYPNEQKKIDVIPVGLEFIEPKKVTDLEEIKLLFLGKMDWGPNKDGLKWFLEEVWPKVNNPKLKLHLVGSGDSTWLSNLKNQKGIEFHGFVKDINPFYSESDFSIIPIRYGSGTRIKVIESISKGLPIISTEMGVQGSGLNHFIKAESSEEWVKILNQLDKQQGPLLAKKAYDELKNVYDYSSIRNILKKSLK